jgi:hypothetical protein
MAGGSTDTSGTGGDSPRDEHTEDSGPDYVAGQKTTGPQGTMSILAGISSTYKDDEGLITTGPVEFTYYNLGTTAAGALPTTTEELSTGESSVLEDFDPQAMGIFTQVYAGQQEHAYGESLLDDDLEMIETTFRLYAPFQSFDPTSPTIGYATEEDMESAVREVNYNDEEIEGLAEKFPYLPSSTSTQDIIYEAIRSLAVDVLQTFPSKQLHFSKAKHPRITSNNLKAFRTNESAQNVSITTSYTETDPAYTGTGFEPSDAEGAMTEMGSADYE